MAAGTPTPLRPTAVLCTHNAGKARELEKLLSGFDLRSLAADDPKPPETGDTFLENARIKAQAGRTRYPDSWVVADDSGLCVEALAGEPGVLSARFGGEQASDADNNRMLLERLAHVRDPASRQARFVCVLVALAPDGGEWIGHGEVAGWIAHEPAGDEGFGYDPLFVPEGESRTFAQLGLQAKAQLSHRARAAQALLAHMRTAPRAHATYALGDPAGGGG